MKPIHFLTAGAIALSSLTGCHRYHGVQYARTEYCRDNPQIVDVYLDQEPSRPYRVIGMVDAPFAIGAGHRVTKMQINACRMGADAIIDQSDGPTFSEERVVTRYGTVVQARVEHRGRQSVRGVAIKYTDGAAPPVAPEAPPTPPAEPAPEPEEEASAPATQQRAGNIQIQTRGGITIQAPSVEFRQAPPSPPPQPARPAQPQSAPSNGWSD